MTRIQGSRILQAPCCGKCYKSPQYASMNFSAREFWTDGWREASLMPNDEGLRQCDCGQYLVESSLAHIATVESSDLGHLLRVAPSDLEHCIATTPQEDVEVAARLEHWRHLNHPYRQKYRLHRDKEEAQTRARWEASRVATRTFWERLLRTPIPRYERPDDAPFTYPRYEPTVSQMRNMERLSEILSSRTADGQGDYAWVLAELYREMGQAFHDRAEAMILTCNAVHREHPRLYQMLRNLIEEGESAPMRYHG